MAAALAPLLKRAKNPIHACVTFSLLWMAAADGTVDEEELAFIAQAGGGASIDTDAMLKLIEARDAASLLLACQLLRDYLTDEGRTAFLSLLIALAVIDRRLAISENHILRFFADLLRIAPGNFARLYEEVAGSAMPTPGDPSSIAWWHSRSTSGRRDGNSTQEEEPRRQQRRGRSGSGMSRAEAYVVLGLRPDASAEEITKAYRRAAQSHHPDRFAELGPQAQQTAHAMFQRIRQAYEVLK